MIYIAIGILIFLHFLVIFGYKKIIENISNKNTKKINELYNNDINTSD